MLDALQTAVSFREGTARPWVTGTSGQGGASAGSYSWSGSPTAARPRPLRHGGGAAGDWHSTEALSARSRGGLEEGRESPAPPGSGARAPHAELGSWEVGIVLLLRDKWLARKHNSPRPLDPCSVLFWHFGIRGNHAVMSAPGGTGKRDAASRPRPASAQSQPSCASG